MSLRKLFTNFHPKSTHTFSTCSTLCKSDTNNRLRKVNKRSQEPFDKRYPITARHVNRYKKWGSKIMEEQVAVHVVQPTGYVDRKIYKFKLKKEMIPEFLVPDLKDFKLKPYVPYNAPTVENEELTPSALFEALYADELNEDFKQGKLKPEMSIEEIAELDSLKNVANNSKESMNKVDSSKE